MTPQSFPLVAAPEQASLASTPIRLCGAGFQAHLGRAAANADIALELPGSKARGIGRFFKRAVGRCLVRALRFLTVPQRLFNRATLDALGELNANLAELNQQLDRLRQTYSHLLTVQSLHDRRLTELADVVNRDARPGSKRLLDEERDSLDRFYAAFEDRFRGSPEDIKERLRIYLPLVQQAGLGAPDRPILDLGCGRGEWLELLDEAGLVARGVDTNRVFLQRCRAAGLEVLEADAIGYLCSLPDRTLGAVTGFHLIEHLPFRALVRLFDEALRVLQPGGLVIFETPNPENLLVGACTFYCDFTHLNPIFPQSLECLAQQRGFEDVQLLRLNAGCLPSGRMQPLPEDHPLAAHLNPVIALLGGHFSTPPDVAVIGRRAV